MANATANLMLVFSRAKADGSPAAAACADPSDDAVAALWELCQGILRREIEVGGAGGGCAGVGGWTGQASSAQDTAAHGCPCTHLRPQVDEDDSSAVIAAKMAAQRGAATKAAQLAVFQAVPQVGGRTVVLLLLEDAREWTARGSGGRHAGRRQQQRPRPVPPRRAPQHAWLAAQLVSQWVGPEAAVSDGAVRRWAPVADIIKETCR